MDTEVVHKGVSSWWARCLLLGCIAVALPAQDPDHVGEISGRVVDECEQPVPAAKITLLDDRRQILRGAMSDGSGTFLVKALSLRCESIVVRIEAKGFAAAEEYVKLRWFDPAVMVEVRLRSADTLRGRVVDDKGAGVVGAEVVLTPASNRWSVPVAAKTDAEGRFTLRAVPLGESSLAAIADGFETKEATVRLPRTDEVSLALVRGADRTLRIRIEGVTDEQARGFWARVHAWSNDDGGRRSVVLPEVPLAGVDTIVRGLLPGWQVHVSLGGKDPHGVDTFTINASPADLASAAVVFHLPAPAELRGRVVGPDGKPCAGLHLKARSSSSLFGTLAVTDAQGEFRMRSPLVTGERLELFAMDAGWTLDGGTGDDHPSAGLGMWGIHSAAGDGAPLALRARRAVIIHGRVVDADGAGVGAAQVHVSAEQAPGAGEPSNSVWSTTTDADGSFSFGRHRATEHSLWVRVGGWNSPVQQGPFRVRDGEVKEIEVRAPPAVRHEGEVLGAQGKPVAGARLVLRDGNDTRGEWYADREGRFVFTTRWCGPGGTVGLADHGSGALAAVTVVGDGANRKWSLHVKE